MNRVAAGASGAGVYRVEAAGQAFVLKVTGLALVKASVTL